MQQHFAALGCRLIPTSEHYAKFNAQSSHLQLIGQAKVSFATTPTYQLQHPPPSAKTGSCSLGCNGTLASSHRHNRQATTVIELVRLLERAFRESHALDPESLCIQSGTKVHCPVMVTGQQLSALLRSGR